MTFVTEPIPKALTIAGSDSGGGAGIQADLKTFAALGAYGSSVITALTAQNTLGVSAVHEVPPDFIVTQIDAVMSDIGADAAKTGMLSSAEIIQAVAEGVQRHKIERLVVDPVMVAKSGDRLLRQEAVEALRTSLLPLAFLVTPNIPEAEVLSGRPIVTENDMIEAARAILSLGAKSVVVKGGHSEGEPVDILFDGAEVHRIGTPRVETRHTHGTGCTFAAAITVGLARGLELQDAMTEAKAYLYGALVHAYEVGAGHSPVNHFHTLWRLSGAGAARED